VTIGGLTVNNFYYLATTGGSADKLPEINALVHFSENYKLNLKKFNLLNSFWILTNIRLKGYLFVKVEENVLVVELKTRVFHCFRTELVKRDFFFCFHCFFQDFYCMFPRVGYQRF